MSGIIDFIIPKLAWLLPPLAFLAWEIAIIRQEYFGIMAIFVVVLAFVGLGVYNRFRLPTKDMIVLSMPPFLLLMSATVVLLVVRYVWIKHVIAALAALAVYWYLRSLYNFLFHISRYKPLSLETMSLYFGIATYGASAVAAFAFMNFLHTPGWYSALGMFIVTMLVSYQYLWINKIDEGRTVLATLLLGIVMVEIVWSLSFFPTSHFVTGFVATVLFYSAINLSLLHFLGKIEQKIIRLYAVMSSVSIGAVLLSAQWL